MGLSKLEMGDKAEAKKYLKESLKLLIKHVERSEDA